MTQVDTSAPVMVTGATGYVAGWLVKMLLEAGATVHAAVRKPDDPKKVGHLQAMADASPGEIRFFKADLLSEGAYHEAAQGCAVIFHTASPFVTAVSDPQKELVDPAVLGTKNVLDEANKVESVRRVVLTSSSAAIFGDNTDCAKAPGGVLTEEVWNTSSSLSHGPYLYSKTLAEKKAWEMVEAQDRWDLVVINPTLVIGPSTNPKPTSESFSIVKKLGDGHMFPAAPRYGMGVVDVREVAQAHVEAAFRPEAEGRHILSGHDTDLLEMGLALREKFADTHWLPHFAAPKAAIWLVGPLLDAALTRDTVTRNVNVPFRCDNSKSQRALGITYRPMKESLEEMFQQMVDTGAFS